MTEWPHGIDIRLASAGEAGTIGNLLQLYMYEFSADVGTDVGNDGRFEWDGLDDYWRDASLHPFLFTVTGRLAGFALVQQQSVLSGRRDVWDMEDFFVLARYRRSSVGSHVADHLFRRFRGPWEIRVLEGNDRALAFWRSAIGRHCGADVAPMPRLINGRRFSVFEFVTPGGG